VTTFDAPFTKPPGPTEVLGFDAGSLGEVRAFVSHRAGAAGLDAARRADLLLAVTELATNSVRHGGGGGILRVWRQEDSLVCEVKDPGHVNDPLVGRRTPTPEQLGGRGVWLAHQVSDLMQLRSDARGTVVRVHMRCGALGA
jgi:anti-sigma regulatory factor (Ser/Thr protein kinase)